MKYSNNRKYRDKEVVEEVKIITKKRVKKEVTVIDKIKDFFKKNNS